MKRLILFISLVLLFVISCNAQIRWPSGAAYEPTYTDAATVDISDLVLSGLTYIDGTIDTSNTINYTTASSELRTGDLLVIEMTENTTYADTITWGTNITGAADPIPAGKTRVITFFWNGSAWIKLAAVQID